jgi:hypothetical protein
MLKFEFAYFSARYIIQEVADHTVLSGLKRLRKLKDNPLLRRS